MILNAYRQREGTRHDDCEWHDEEESVRKQVKGHSSHSSTPLLQRFAETGRFHGRRDRGNHGGSSVIAFTKTCSWLVSLLTFQYFQMLLEQCGCTFKTFGESMRKGAICIITARHVDAEYNVTRNDDSTWCRHSSFCKAKPWFQHHERISAYQRVCFEPTRDKEPCFASTACCLMQCELV